MRLFRQIFLRYSWLQANVEGGGIENSVTGRRTVESALRCLMHGRSKIGKSTIYLQEVFPTHSRDPP